MGALRSLSRRWASIVSMTAWSSMQAITFTGPPQRAQVASGTSLYPMKPGYLGHAFAGAVGTFEWPECAA